MKFFSSLLGFVFLTIASQAQVTVTPANKSLSTNGVFYSLPKTVVNVEVTIEKESFYAGPLASYADEYLGLENVSTSDNNTFRITEIKVGKDEIPDADQFYFIEFTPDDMKDKHQFSMMLSENGLLTGFNHQVSVSDKGKDKTVVSLGNEKEDRNKLFNYQDITGMQQVIDTVIRTITVDTATIEEFQISKNWVRKTREEKARQAAERIQKILQDRYYLSIGYQEVAYEEGTIEYMDNRLKERQNEYEALFTGKTITSKQSYQFEFIPEKSEKTAREVLLRFSPNSGVRDAKSTIGEPVYITVRDDMVTGTIESKARQLLQTSKAKKGIFYRVPGYAVVSVDADGESLFSRRMRINQLGIVSFAPISRKMGFELHPSSGSIKKVDLEFQD
ncbi:MAG TPA: DUF4831 family protein [Bacteroidales bacterium]|nr:DUF4831 family protein [Bacteroidales bacterium]